MRSSPRVRVNGDYAMSECAQFAREGARPATDVAEVGGFTPALLMNMLSPGTAPMVQPPSQVLAQLVQEAPPAWTRVFPRAMRVVPFKIVGGGDFGRVRTRQQRPVRAAYAAED